MKMDFQWAIKNYKFKVISGNQSLIILMVELLIVSNLHCLPVLKRGIVPLGVEATTRNRKKLYDNVISICHEHIPVRLKQVFWR